MRAKRTVYEIKGEVTGAIPALGGKNLLREASGDDLRVLLVLLEKGGCVSDEELSDLVGCSVGRVRASLDYWIEGRVIIRSESDAEKPAPLRSASELADASGKEVAEIVSRRNLAGLIDEAQAIYGKVFNTSEIGVIAGLSE